ncbi:hypothetical protein AMK26_12240 [Streptomyces sp. CB03234]|uniref:DUF3515 domain-containing protein n=1 Tax=Streptomyces sp. (strain CB03234) TaxID=1703937 RepID=UPI00093A9FD0|nr:DUF3515 domain-containing protein [Streptomyces sp. CB03234]OKK06742.1 hypothetical protein AMK26_12240 [Streptomyces sp. CB03234]
MTSSHRLRRLPALLFATAAAATVLLAAVGCSPTDAEVSVAVPSPPSEEAALCGALHEELPETVAGLGRSDPEPGSDLTAGWGDGAIVLRCGVPRPARMSDPRAEGVEAGGVNWMLEQREGDGPRFTSTARETYVEVSLDERFAHDASPLAALADAVKKTVPPSV